MERFKSWSKEKVLLKLLSKAQTGLWTTDRAATNQMTIPFNKLPGSTTIASLGQQILGKLKPATFSSPHSQEPCIKLGKVGGIGLFKFSNNCKNGEHLM